ncbi:helix-turn-helix domain-containing protein [Denitrobaculum tricleocarpae]|uniref:Helix-turn-helix domain-containing protein n=1 Tax=Denitrobaculum tricleocarpae TaxID=2591009 RepID=A0A545TKM3_9PROT|nr:helix-turn-helix domain-containing protein [Denitrobaculum tricleocarpae]TQV77757.1 helix-turn-helix domain-containing protein [Denitrobaculum tricleocarpae]
MPTRFSTRDVRDHERFSYWREAVCDAYVQLGCECDGQDGFQGDIRLERLSKLSLSRVSGNAHSVYRRGIDIARSSDAFFLLSLQLKKRSRVTQHDRGADLETGDLVLYSSVDPYALDLTDSFEQLVVQVPRGKLLTHLPAADLLTGRRLSGKSAIGKVVGNGIRQIADGLQYSDTPVQDHMQDAIIDLIAAGLASVNDVAYEVSQPEQRLISRTKAFIEANLSDPGLDRNRVAAAMGMSVRRLNEIFSKEETSLAAVIRESRLQQIARDLEDPRLLSQSVSEIAMRWGLNNFQHFSRIFKDRFGCAPRDYRARARLLN